MNECKECYTSKKRITPLLKPRECLENHLQYICSTCGRCICINRTDTSGLQRWNFPFKTLDIAKLYLRTAEVTTKTNCGIYEIKCANGRKLYKIFSNKTELQEYLKKNKNKTCDTMTPIYQRPVYLEFDNSEIRRLNNEEVEKYIQEQKEE
ncbi:hypothetical protein [Candidatus Methanomassiliicoccus intestinalis]|uniref:hypothetical protein n=1 Tax=Candidatus Methanomassiliicoccus intestinalis TaxID=1406512 RepID=UPI0037DD076E